MTEIILESNNQNQIDFLSYIKVSLKSLNVLTFDMAYNAKQYTNTINFFLKCGQYLEKLRKVSLGQEKLEEKEKKELPTKDEFIEHLRVAEQAAALLTRSCPSNVIRALENGKGVDELKPSDVLGLSKIVERGYDELKTYSKSI